MAKRSLKRVTRKYLEFQSDRLEAVLASHKVPARVDGGDVSPRWVRFKLQTAAGSRIATVRNLSEEIAMALGAPQVRVMRDGQQLAVEMPRPDPEPVPLLRLMEKLQNLPRVTACLGVAEDGRPLLLRLPSPDVVHVLVAGTTGSGKTELMRTLVMSLAATNRQAHLQLALIDPKGRGLGPLGRLPHLMTPLINTVAGTSNLLGYLVDEMEHRDRRGISSPHIVIVVDEVVDLLMMGGKPLTDLLIRLAQRGREAGLHLILGSQKPASKVFDSQLKSNFPVRLVGRMGSAEDARTAAGISGSGAERLLGRGDFVAVAAGQATRFQAAYVGPADWASFYNAIYRGDRLVNQGGGDVG